MYMPIPSQAWKQEGVESGRRTPKIEISWGWCIPESNENYTNHVILEAWFDSKARSHYFLLILKYVICWITQEVEGNGFVIR